MRKKDALDDLELYIDPKPLTKEEEIALSLFIKKLKDKAQRLTVANGSMRRTRLLLGRTSGR
jgi:hypothetical protein